MLLSHSEQSKLSFKAEQVFNIIMCSTLHFNPSSSISIGINIRISIGISVTYVSTNIITTKTTRSTTIALDIKLNPFGIVDLFISKRPNVFSEITVLYDSSISRHVRLVGVANTSVYIQEQNIISIEVEFMKPFMRASLVLMPYTEEACYRIEGGWTVVGRGINVNPNT